MGFSKFSKKECRSSFEVRLIKMPDQPTDDAMPTGHNINGASKFSDPKKAKACSLTSFTKSLVKLL